MAKTTNELNDILSLRYGMAKETGRSMGRLAQFTEKLIDHLDIFPTTLNLVAYRNGIPIASLRATECRATEPLQHLVFDYRESLANLKGSTQGPTFLMDMLILDRDGEAGNYLARHLIRTVLGILAQRNVTRCFFSLPTSMPDLVRKFTGAASEFPNGIRHRSRQ